MEGRRGNMELRREVKEGELIDSFFSSVLLSITEYLVINLP